MTNKEKLVELLRQCVTQNITLDPDCWDAIIDVDYGRMADSLLGSGVVVLPCKVGDTVWFIRPLDRKKEITETVIEKMVLKGKGVYMKLSCNAMYETSCNSIGKTVFLTRDEAEAALRKEEKDSGV